MKEVTIKVYSFDELSPKAKEVARTWYRGDGDYYPQHEENEKAVRAFADHFGLSGLSWEYGEGFGSASARTFPEYGEDIKGLRLYAWLGYNHFDYLFPPLYIGKRPRKYSNWKRAASACPTGYCISEAMLDPIYNFLRAPDKDTTLEDLLSECLTTWAKDCGSDMEYSNSDEAVDENIMANDYAFLASGKCYE